MIQISNIQYATLIAAKEIPKKEQRLLARKLEKYLLRNYSVVCEVETI